MNETMKDMIDFVHDKLRLPDEGDRELCRKALSRWHRAVYDEHLWVESKVALSLTATSEIVVLPYFADLVLGVGWNNDVALDASLQENVLQLDPSLFVTSTTPMKWSPIEDVAVEGEAAGESVTIESDSSLDVSLEVEIRGELNGKPERESVTLDGTTPVTTSNGYDQIYQLAKPNTSGTVIVKNADGDVIQTLWAEEAERRHRRVLLLAKPSESKPVLVLVKKRCPRFYNDGDTPFKPGIMNMIIEYATGDILEHRRAFLKGGQKFGHAGQLFQSAQKRQAQQEGFVAQVIPCDNGHWGIEDLE